LKRYHEFLLTLGLGDTGEEWSFDRIGTAAEKQSVDKELATLREQLAKVEEWKLRRKDIDDELNKVWIEGGELDSPTYLETDEKDSMSASTPAVVQDSDILYESQASFLSKGSGEET
jgi:ATP-binding cassette subfamily D (ALD) long-chain fatty acid import protein